MREPAPKTPRRLVSTMLATTSALALTACALLRPAVGPRAPEPIYHFTRAQYKVSVEQLTFDQRGQFGPRIQGDTIVYFQRDETPPGQLYHTYMYDLRTGTIAKLMPGSGPEIGGDVVVNSIFRENSFYDISHGQLVSQASKLSSARVDGGRIVYHDDRNGNWDIYMYMPLTYEERQITDDPGNQRNPSIHGDTIVYQDNRNGNWDIYMYTVSTGEERPVCTDPRWQGNPQVFGDKVVWEDRRNVAATGQPQSDIYVKDLGTGEEIQITDDVLDETTPAIWGDTVVWQVDRSPPSLDFGVYAHDLRTGETIELTPGDEIGWHPDVFENRVVWQRGLTTPHIVMATIEQD